MGDARFLKLLGDVDRAMADAATALEQKRGVRGVSRTTQIWSSPSQDSDQAIFAVYLETVNEFGYELCWTFEVTEASGRYVVDRILYGRGRSERYRGGQETLFEIPEIEFGTQHDLCAKALELVREFQESFDKSLEFVPND